MDCSPILNDNCQIFMTMAIILPLNFFCFYVFDKSIHVTLSKAMQLKMDFKPGVKINVIVEALKYVRI